MTVESINLEEAVAASIRAHSGHKYHKWDNDALEADAKRIVASIAAMRIRKRIAVGEWVQFPDGTFRRVAHSWTGYTEKSADGECEALQFGNDSISYYLCHGEGSYSGGLDSVEHVRIEDSGETRPARFWVAKGNYLTAGCGVEFVVPVRVFRVV